MFLPTIPFCSNGITVNMFGDERKIDLRRALLNATLSLLGENRKLEREPM